MQFVKHIKYPKGHVSRTWRVADLCAAYGIPQGTSPGGGVIGILEFGGGITQADLDQFSTVNGLPQIKIIDVNVGNQNSPGGDADDEVALDIEVTAAAYYYATGKIPTIRVYWGNDFETVVTQAAADKCDVLSISWGSDEPNFGQAEAQQLEAAFAAALAKGMPSFASSGDNSSSDGDQGANVDLPAGCPSVVGCGGTTKGTAGEVVWGNGTSNGEGTGGGFSKFFERPAWQIGAPANGGNMQSRMVPDISADADPTTGILIVLNGQEFPIGGTSAVSPFYAGLFAAMGKSLGAVNPKLWSNPKAFTDITQGSNGGFSAATGPDPCTGLGVPTAALMTLFTSTVPPVPPIPPVPPVLPIPPVPVPSKASFTFDWVNSIIEGVAPWTLTTSSAAPVAEVFTIDLGNVVKFPKLHPLALLHIDMVLGHSNGAVVRKGNIITGTRPAGMNAVDWQTFFTQLLAFITALLPIIE